MQTILGANGVIATELARVLPVHGPIRLVSRSPRRVNEGDELYAADLLDPRATADAVAGSAIAYLVAGLKYDTAVWREQWPIVMRNVVEACKRHGSSLVFLDNVYALGRVDGPMTEATPLNPCSRKGEVRAAIASTLMAEMAKGELKAMIVRSADFYGPGAALSFTHATVTERLRAGKAPQWMGNPKARHTFSYTRDVARSLALLGNQPQCFGQVWHALSSHEVMTGERYVQLACEIVGQPFRLQAAPKWMLSLMGLFVPVLRENMEMLYQFEHDYLFDSSKAEQALGVAPTSYREGLTATLLPAP